MSLGIASVAPQAVTDPVLQAWQEQIRAATPAARPLVIAGGGSKHFYGRPLLGETLDVTSYRGIVAYEPTELVITAKCGTPLTEVEAALAEKGQMLACEPPHFAGAPTIGGVVAAGLSGPRRMAAGAVRDFVLGVKVMNGRGELLNFGGQVMKNVAGYDVSRLMAGSLGCLGILAEVSLKVVPKPRLERSLRFQLSEREALERLARWAGKALPVSASVWHAGVLHIRLSGAEAAVAAARDQLGGEDLSTEQATAFWTSLRDQTHPFFAGDQGTGADAVIRCALPETTPPVPLPGPQLVEWGGAQRWCRASVEHFIKIRTDATFWGGHATVFRPALNPASGPRADEVFTPLAAPLLRIHRQLKQVFDPAGIFNRGRMYQEF